MDSALCIVENDLRLWLRKPIHVGMAVLPILMVLIIVGMFLVSAESLPTGVILLDDDPMAAEIAEYIGEARSGAGLPWWTIKYMGGEEVHAAYAEGRILCYVTVPAGVSRRLAEGDVVEIGVTVNNVNDD
ncbi:hypothetical protein JXL21_07830, partial [Candidatus Bathyarchaeota archaeon]|nr:hypothetical protein [Candidatus Bathyarchaeota archaeon]